MISVELWRARIGTFNNKRCSAGCALYSLLLSTSLPSSANCRQYFSQEKPASRSDITQISSSYSSLLVTADNQLTSRHLHHAVSISDFSLHVSSASSSSQETFSSRTSSSSFWSSYSSSFPCDQFFLHRDSLLKESVITLLIAIISQLLMIAGDIETNPGPKHRGEINEPYYACVA